MNFLLRKNRQQSKLSLHSRRALLLFETPCLRARYDRDGITKGTRTPHPQYRTAARSTKPRRGRYPADRISSDSKLLSRQAHHI